MEQNKPYISIVIPAYNEQAVLGSLYQRLTKVMDSMGKSYEVIIVNDGSKDNTAAILNELHARRPHVFKIVHFNGNFGQHMAIMAGFERSKGEIVISMDADLQNPPEEIPKLVAEMEKGHDVVNTFRVDRQDKLWRVLASKMHNWFRAKLIAPKFNLKDEGSMLRAYRNHIVKAMVATEGCSTFIPILALVYASNPTEVGIAHESRAAGETNYNFYKLIRYNFDLVTNFSVVPLQIFTFIGMGVSSLSILFVLYLFVRRLIVGPEAQGLFTLFAIAFFVMGLILLGLGIVGEYVGRIYQEVLKRPRYIVKEFLE